MPQVTAAELVSFLQGHGFAEQRSSGSHRLFRHGDGRRTLVPFHPGDLGRRLAIDILMQAGFSVDDFLALR